MLGIRGSCWCWLSVLGKLCGMFMQTAETSDEPTRDVGLDFLRIIKGKQVLGHKNLHKDVCNAPLSIGIVNCPVIGMTGCQSSGSSWNPSTWSWNPWASKDTAVAKSDSKGPPLPSTEVAKDAKDTKNTTVASRTTPPDYPTTSAPAVNYGAPQQGAYPGAGAYAAQPTGGYRRRQPALTRISPQLGWQPLSQLRLMALSLPMAQPRRRLSQYDGPRGLHEQRHGGVWPTGCCNNASLPQPGTGPHQLATACQLRLMEHRQRTRRHRLMGQQPYPVTTLTLSRQPSQEQLGLRSRCFVRRGQPEQRICLGQLPASGRRCSSSEHDAVHARQYQAMTTANNAGSSRSCKPALKPSRAKPRPRRPQRTALLRRNDLRERHLLPNGSTTTTAAPAGYQQPAAAGSYGTTNTAPATNSSPSFYR